MNVEGFCPQCNSAIPSERYLTGYAICECGWYDKTPVAKAYVQFEKKVIASMLFAAITLTLLYGHMLNWGGYAFEIPIVKVEQLTGTLSKKGYEELAQACIVLNKWSCAQNAYLDLYRQAGDAEGLARLGHLQGRLNEKAAAQSSFASYFKAGGKNADAAIEYGTLLEGAGQMDAAMKAYEDSIRLRPETLPINATTSIVRLMIKVGHYDEAYQRIVAFHESAGNAEGYLNTELAQLEPRVSASVRNASKHSGLAKN
jgi:tetratricopeptide (TPR) repeat protein